MDKQALRKADLITSIILFGVSSAICVMSVKLLMNSLSKGRQWFESAGLFPLIVAVFLGICSVSLFLRARKDGARFDFITKDNILKLLKMKEFRVGCTIIGLLTIYIIVMMLPGRQYEAATFFYLFISMIAFQKRTRKSIINSLIIAVISTAVLEYGFGHLACVLLP